MRRKTKIYLDTSVISHLDAEDVPEKMRHTREFWEKVKLGLEFDVFVSDLTNFELQQCYEPKRTRLFAFLSEVEHVAIARTEEIIGLADRYLEYGVLTKKDYDDLRHMAYAVVSQCDCIASWNLKHFVNDTTMDRVNVVNLTEGYRSIEILTPQKIIGGENDSKSR